MCGGRSSPPPRSRILGNNKLREIHIEFNRQTLEESYSFEVNKLLD